MIFVRFIVKAFTYLLCALLFILMALPSGDVEADETQIEEPMPIIDGYQTLAKMPLPYGAAVYLTESPKECPVDYKYGMMLDSSGDIDKWFCWRLNKYRGTIESTDTIQLPVEEFNWTKSGLLFIRNEIKL